MTLVFCTGAAAQSDDRAEPVAIVEAGGAPSHSLSGEGWNVGPTVAVEITPIDNWLELEFGVTRSLSRAPREWNADLLFKKPWTLTDKVEFMFGIGPEWVNTKKSSVLTNSLSSEVVLDFMFWSAAHHRIGWYLEPAYDRSFASGHDKSVGVSAGMLIAIR